MFFKAKNTHLYQSSQLYVAESYIAGLGVFTSKFISKKNIVEVCPVIALSVQDASIVKNTDLYRYYFIINEHPFNVVIALGYGSVYNHAYKANASYTYSKEQQTLTILAESDIVAGEEITLNYNGPYNDPTPIVF